MDEATVRKRCEEWLKNNGYYLNQSEDGDVTSYRGELESLIAFHRAAYADGLEQAAKIADTYPKRDPAEDGNGYWAAEEVAKQIRLHKQEVET